MTHTKEQKINIIWRETHPDYRGTLGSSPSIMFNGGVCAIDSLPDDVFEDRYNSAMQSIERDKIRKVAVSLFNRHGFTSLDPGVVNQWCSSFQGIRDLIVEASNIPAGKKDKLSAELGRLEESFYSDRSDESEKSL